METSIHIVNLTQGTGTVNNSNGEFEIPVAINDSILFSSVQFEILKIMITADHIKNRFLEVNLVPITLDAVKISDKKLSGNLERDIAGIKVVDPTEFGLPWPKPPSITPSERKVYTASSTNVDLLLNTISGRLAMLKKHDANMKRNDLVEKAFLQQRDNFFFEVFELDQNGARNFLFFCTETDADFSKLVDKQDPFRLIDYYHQRFPEFLKVKKGENRD
ncbi:MAG TPA: hypothetical protein VFM70_07455 [Salinimicrobium sp.]|nr:hypothetical protein [Salinimicrobium sp.]